MFGLFSKKWTCPVCQSKNNDAVRFCPSCGTEKKEYREVYDAFISYRRVGGSEAASAIQLLLEKYGKYAFLDVTELQVGRFDEKLLERIEKDKSFILVLSPGALDRCVEKSDWLKREIVHAIKCRKNIVPVFLPGFTFPDETTWALFPEEMRVLPNMQAVVFDHVNRDAMGRKLAQYISSPTAGYSVGVTGSRTTRQVSEAREQEKAAAPEKPVAPEKRDLPVAGEKAGSNVEAPTENPKVSTGAAEKGDGFRLVVEDVFSITGRGMVFTGRVENASAKVEDRVRIIQDSITKESVITGIEIFRKLVQSAAPGSNVGLLLRGIEKGEFSRGAVVTGMAQQESAKLPLTPQSAPQNVAPVVQTVSPGDRVTTAGVKEQEARVHDRSSGTLPPEESAESNTPGMRIGPVAARVTMFSTKKGVDVVAETITVEAKEESAVEAQMPPARIGFPGIKPH